MADDKPNEFMKDTGVPEQSGDASEASQPASDGWQRPEAAMAADAERIAALEAEVAELKDRHLRDLAEMETVRKRAQRDREDAAKFGASSFARDLLSVADNLRRALESVPAEVFRK